ncbi:MarR family winged helix-turn-helix transcriptional regulator [Aneurinibacillus danicus]|jgi:DNA-binding MarR family transcriptional regulator|uniref:HTH-type transcriptional regulator SarZ n=1 Tax=Aneurinibacillus danicus TaxID=267746 RepID=A0A511VAD5_9BACL|nr:MarR family transcriptional regulator [Aneurinibacillus danicus]GEN35819.1 MarR family transcriptional regulator [Aneurinibacillus danicus]
MGDFDKKIERLEQAYVSFMRQLGPKLSEDTELGLTGPQFYILHLLSKKEKFMVTEIASEMGVKPSAITVMIERLHKNRLVMRDRDENDRRVVFIHLTEKGKEVLQKAKQRRFKTISHYLKHLESEELENLVKIYEKLARIASTVEDIN